MIGWLTTKHESGIVLNTNNAYEIVDGIIKLIENPEIAKELGMNGRKAYSNHTVDLAAEKILHIVNSSCETYR